MLMNGSALAKNSINFSYSLPNHKQTYMTPYPLGYGNETKTLNTSLKPVHTDVQYIYVQRLPSLITGHVYCIFP